MATKKKIRGRITKIIRQQTGLPIPAAAGIARALVKAGGDKSELRAAAQRGVPGLEASWTYNGGCCGDPGCCGGGSPTANATGPKGDMDWDDLFRALSTARTASPPPPTPRKPRERKPLPCAGCSRTIPQDAIAEAKRRAIRLVCRGCGTRRGFGALATPVAPRAMTPAPASYDHAACMIAFLAR